MKNKKIVIKLKHFYENDPVDRLRGKDIYFELKKRNYNVELYNLQKNIDILLILDDKINARALFNRQEIKVEKIIFDIQDDHFNLNKKSIKALNSKIIKKSFLRRIMNLNVKKIKEKLLTIVIQKMNSYLFKDFVEKSDFVITSSYSLAKITKNYNESVVCIPDSIDFSLYPLKKSYNDEVSLVWIGTDGNIPYLSIIDKVLYDLQRKYNIKIKVISSQAIYENPYSKQFLDKFEFEFEFIEWKKKTFGYELTQAEIGIAPLPDGMVKSTNKVLSYMASGLPVVCSNVFDYHQLNEKYENSIFIADNVQEWEKHLETLILDKDLRTRKGIEGRDIAQNFSLESTVDKYEELFKSLM